jgi:hypothetical protein
MNPIAYGEPIQIIEQEIGESIPIKHLKPNVQISKT